MKQYPLTCPLCKGSLKIDNRLSPKGGVYVCANAICRSGHLVRKGAAKKVTNRKSEEK